MPRKPPPRKRPEPRKPAAPKAAKPEAWSRVGSGESFPFAPVPGETPTPAPAPAAEETHPAGYQEYPKWVGGVLIARAEDDPTKKHDR